MMKQYPRCLYGCFRKIICLFGLAIGISNVSAKLKTEGISSLPVKHVIQIGADAGGAKYLGKFLKEYPEDFKNLQRMIDEGASTMNARTDYFITITQPNFTSMITGRPSKDLKEFKEGYGHYIQRNWDLRKTDKYASFHAVNPRGEYLTSVFDVVHDAGYSTGVYWGANKFHHNVLLSYGEKFGKDHRNGKRKIDFQVGGTAEERLQALKKYKANFSFIYFPDADQAGHKFGYLSDEYRDALKRVDGYVGQILQMAETDSSWKDQTVIIFTADHGGKPPKSGHGDATHPKVYTIPFIVWGKGVAKGADLYALNKDSRKDPKDGRPEYGLENQPIRNGDSGNLVTSLLGLPPIPGSFINQKQDLKLR